MLSAHRYGLAVEVWGGVADWGRDAWFVLWLQSIFGTAALDPWALLLVAPFGLVVWGADELRRRHLRFRATHIHPLTKEQPC